MNKRFILFFKVVVFVLLLPILSSASSLEQQLQKLRDAGIPTTLEELNLPEIPDEQNGALVYREIFKLDALLGEKYSRLYKYFPYQGIGKWENVPKEEKKKVTDLIFHNPEFAKLYQLLEKASQMECLFLTEKDYQKDLNTIAKNLLPHLSELRSCARLLAAKAKIEAENGNIDKALHTTLTGLRTSKSLSNEPVLISQLVKIAMESIALRTMEEVINKGEANLNLYQTLLSEIANERKNTLSKDALKGEFVIFGLPGMFRNRKLAKETLADFEKKFAQMSEKEKEEVKKHFGDSGVSGDTKKSMLKFMDEYWNEEISVYIETMFKMIPLTGKSYWEGKGKIDELARNLQKMPVKKAVLTKQLLQALIRAYTQEAKLDALLGAAEIGIANRIYRLKNGKFVDNLNQLTPEILSSLPLDPFTGKDYIYKKKDKGFIVYSVGEDLVDDGGVEKSYTKPDIVWEDTGGKFSSKTN